MDSIVLSHSECDMKLLTLALVKTSIILWEQPDIKMEIRNFFSDNNKDSWKLKTWHKITQKVLNLADGLVNCVNTVLLELKDAILNTGMKIYDWIYYVRLDLGLDVSHTEQMFWTPLGFVDEKKIFKLVWEKDASLYEASPDKPIFRLACLLIQEDFIDRHKLEMIEELKKLPTEANLNNVELEVVNYPDKIYGIISTYVSYYVNQYSDLGKDDEVFKVLLFQVMPTEMFNIAVMLKNVIMLKNKNVDHINFKALLLQVMPTVMLNKGVMMNNENVDHINFESSIRDGTILPSDLIVKLSVWPGLIHVVKYYYSKLDKSQKRSVSSWLINYCTTRFLKRNSDHYMAGKYREIVAFICNKSDVHDFNYSFNTKFAQLCRLLHFYPLESVIMGSKFNKWLNQTGCEKLYFLRLLGVVAEHMKIDYTVDLPVKRNLFQRLMKEVLIKFGSIKVQATKTLIIYTIIYLCIHIHDFTILRTFLQNFKFHSADYQQYLRLTFEIFLDEKPSDFDVEKKFFNVLFDSRDDFITFLIEGFYKIDLFKYHGSFDAWENYYSSFNFLNERLRDRIDPVKCLGILAGRGKIELCDKFIEWWHESQEQQSNLKDKFRTSSYPSKCIYKYWLDKFNDRRSSVDEKITKLLNWLYDSEGDISHFKKEKLSIIGLLDASLNDFEHGLIINRRENQFYSVMQDFINFCQIPLENLSNSQKEIKSKIEDLMVKHAKICNISTFDFLMDWVSLSEEEKKKIFQKLNDSSKILKLCQDALHLLSRYLKNGIFYNNWLKLSGNVSELKNNLISIYKTERDEKFVVKLSLMYEKLEKGECLASDDIIFDYNSL